jgi:hypothetical protein
MYAPEGDDAFQSWQDDLRESIRAGVEEACCGGEVDCVKAMVRHINDAKPPALSHWSVAAESALLHGGISQVKFTIAGVEQPRRELADLCVIAASAEKGQLTGFRVCFIQSKANHRDDRHHASYDIDGLQLWLLSRFPKFEGIGRFVKGPSYHLNNTTGMLGAYGFLSHPGEMSLLSARVLANVLAECAGRDKSREIDARELAPTLAALGSGWSRDCFCPHRASTGGDTTALATLSYDDFVREWTGLRLGEPWYSTRANHRDVAVRTLVDRIVAAAVDENQLPHVAQLFHPDVPREEPEASGEDRDTGHDAEAPALGILAVILDWRG